ncbi:MAG: hypothetical protein QW814_00465 [Methanothrix sp.]
METIRRVISFEKPDNLVMLGDNIELERFSDHKEAYATFYKKLDGIFPIKKSIILLGDNDYQYSSDKSISNIIISYTPMNLKTGELIFFSKGNMHFFHGNLEKSKFIERLGYYFVKTANSIDYNIAPNMMAFIARKWFRIRKEDYLFLGHLHYLGIHSKSIFCGTLNHEFMPFPNSLGYVTLMHNNFRVLPKSIRIIRIQTNRAR